VRVGEPFDEFVKALAAGSQPPRVHLAAGERAQGRRLASDPAPVVRLFEDPEVAPRRREPGRFHAVERTPEFGAPL
jgi:hypothetical protein